METTTQKNSAVVKKIDFNPEWIIGSSRNMTGLLDKFKPKFASLLPAHLSPKRLVATAVSAAYKNEKILECTSGSIVDSVTRAAELGLDCSGTLGLAYLVPYWNKKRGAREAQLIIGFRGFVLLAIQSGEVKRIDAEVVYTNDVWQYEKGSSPVVKWAPDYRDRGEPWLVYALAEMRTGAIQAVVMTVQEVQKIRSQSKAKDSGPWVDYWDEMAKKTAVRRLAKMLPLSNDRLNLAMATNDLEFDFDADTNSYKIDQKAAVRDLNNDLLGAPAKPPAIDDGADVRVEDSVKVEGAALSRPVQQAVEASGFDPATLEADGAGALAMPPKPDEEPAAAEEDETKFYQTGDALDDFLSQFFEDPDLRLEVVLKAIDHKPISMSDLTLVQRKRTYKCVKKAYERLRGGAEDPNYEVTKFFVWAMNSKSDVKGTAGVNRNIPVYRDYVSSQQSSAEAAPPAEAPKQELEPFNDQC